MTESHPEPASVRRIIPAFVILGVALRLRVFLANHSLRHDEAELSLNILGRTFAELLRPLDRVQGAPLGFLWAEKAAATLLGPGEMSLRLVPLLASLAALPLFVLVARRLLDPVAAVVAIGLFAISERPIYYGAETKQYSSDLAIGLAILAMALGRRARPSPVRWVGLALLGMGSVWFSHPSVFVLASVGVWGLLSEAGGGRWRPSMARWGPVAFAWSASVFAVELASLRSLRGNRDLLDFWSAAFAPMPPRSMVDLRWYGNHGLEVFADPMGLPVTGLAALAFVLGVVSFWRRDRLGLILLLGPPGLALLASGLGKYPFSGRLILFCVPMGLILIAEGMTWCWRRGGATIGTILAVLLLLGPSVDAARNLIRPPRGEELRPVMQTIARNTRPGDEIFVYYAAEPAWTYYTRFARPRILPDASVTLGRSGRDDWSVFDADLSRLPRKPRVWIVFSHVVKVNGVDEEKYLLCHLDRMGRRVEAIEGFGASAYLYDLAGR